MVGSSQNKLCKTQEYNKFNFYIPRVLKEVHTVCEITFASRLSPFNLSIINFPGSVY